MFNKLKLLNLEFKLLIIATSIIPIVIFGTILVLISYGLIYEYFIPPKPTFSSLGGSGQYHPFLAGFRMFVALSLAFSGILLFHKRILYSVISLILSISVIIWRTFQVYSPNQKVYDTEIVSTNFTNDESSFEILVSTIEVVDALFLIFILTLLFWQISILLRMLIKTLQRKTKLP